jgi:hypothetical protein
MTTETKPTTGFRKYDKLQRQGQRFTRGIEEGDVLVFPKLDGTNASVWSDGETVFAGSRNRMLDEGKNDDNAGFRAWLMGDDETATSLRALALANPAMIFYGEWLVPHTIKGYEEAAWRKFYIFDVFARSEDFRGFVAYDDYQEMLATAGVDYIFPIARFENPTGAELKDTAEGNTYLMTGENIGEGVVVKNYAWRNADVQDRVWGKFVRSEFKSAAGAKCAPRPTVNVEPAVAEEFVTDTLVQKTLAKVVNDILSGLTDEQRFDIVNTGQVPREYVLANFRGQVIPQLIGRVWFDIIDEEMAAIVKRFKNPTIDFKALRSQVATVTKTLVPELF